MRNRALLSAALIALLGRAEAREPLEPSKAYDGPVPKRMETDKTPIAILKAFDVYFNGEKQTECTVADTEAGYIVRYIRSKRTNQLVRCDGSYATEKLHGKVEFVRKGEVYKPS